MRPKKIGVIFPFRKHTGLQGVLTRNLKDVFQDSVSIAVYILDEIPPQQMLDGDIFLLLLEDGIFDLKHRIANLSSVIPITRAIRKKSIPEIMQLPPGTDVLVVNDNYELTVQTANGLFELGINHVNWIAYNENLPPVEAYQAYKDIPIAITPNEAPSVPPYIPQIIDIGDRYIDTYTMIRIGTKLRLGSDLINRNLLRYKRLLAEPESSITHHYLGNYLVSEMFKHYLYNINEGILFCDTQYQMIYANSSVYRIFEMDREPEYIEMRELLGESLYGKITSDAFTSDLITIGDNNYTVTKEPMADSDNSFGFCIVLRDEKSIRDLGSDLNSKLVKRGLYARHTFDSIIHRSPVMQDCIQRAHKAAKTGFSVLIQGESGTGKELLAQSIHNVSPRKNKPFVAINCAAMPESLLASELFGYEGGAYTGARKNGKPGLLEQAGGGTVFLDEIGDMPSSLQSLLLRALQEKQIMRLGSDRIINVDVRIIAATNKNLRQEVERGNFRQDLFYRLNILPLHIPPLRSRAEDIPPLLRHFLGRDFDRLTSQELALLQGQWWPGNVRQLENCSNYYRTMGSLSGYLFDSPEPPTLDDTFHQEREAVLRIIARHTTATHGIGRNALLVQLNNGSNRISEARLRGLLKELREMGYISIQRGRGGCRVTEQGTLSLTS